MGNFDAVASPVSEEGAFSGFASPVEVTERPGLSAKDQTLRTAGRGIRDVLGGVGSAADVALLPVKTALQGGAMAYDALGAPKSAESLRKYGNAPSMRDSVLGVIDENTNNVFQPQNDIERFADGVIEFATPMGVYGKIASEAKPITQAGKALKEVGELQSTAAKVGAVGSTLGYATAQAIAPDSTAAQIILPLAGGLSAAGVTKIPAVMGKIAETGVKGAVSIVKAAGNAAEKSVSKIMEANLPQEIKSLDPSQRIIFQAIKAEGHDINTALDVAKNAKEFGIDIPIFQLLDSPTLRAYSKTLTEFGGGAKVGREAIKNLKEKQIPQSIDSLIKQVGTKGLSADENAAVMRQMSEDIMSQSLADLKTQAKPIYDEVLTSENLIPDEWFGDIKSRPVFQAAVSRVVKKPSMQQYLGVTMKQAEDGTETAVVSIPKNSMRFLDAVQKEMEVMAQSAQAKSDPLLGNFDARIIGDTKRTLLDYMDEAFPRYKEARQIYSDDLKDVKALKDGPLGIIKDMSSGESRQDARKIFKLNPPQIRDLRKTFTESGINGSKEAWNDGVAAYLEDAFEATKDGRNYRDVVFGNDLQRQRLAAAIPEKAAQLERFFSVLEEAYQATKLGGSDTASKQAAQAVMGEGLSDFADVAGILTNPRQTTLGFMRRAYQKSVIDDPQGAQKMSRYLFTPEGEDLLKSLNKIESK